MNALDSAPSPKNARKRFGTVQAMTKASITCEAPKTTAMTVSRAIPRRRLTNVRELTTPAERTAFRLSSCRLWDAPSLKRPLSYTSAHASI